jgi:hypothetical protein
MGRFPDTRKIDLALPISRIGAEPCRITGRCPPIEIDPNSKTG